MTKVDEALERFVIFQFAVEDEHVGVSAGEEVATSLKPADRSVIFRPPIDVVFVGRGMDRRLT